MGAGGIPTMGAGGIPTLVVWPAIHHPGSMSRYTPLGTPSMLHGAPRCVHGVGADIGVAGKRPWALIPD